jgi:hypothetical protein
MKNHWKKTTKTRRELEPLGSVQIKPQDFSKNNEDIRKMILSNRPDLTTIQKRKKSFFIAKKLAQTLKKRDLSKDEIDLLLTKIDEQTAAVSPVARRNIDLILKNNLRRLNTTLRNLLDKGEDIVKRIDTVLAFHLHGVGIGVISSILFAYDHEKYCIYNLQVVKGLSRIFDGVTKVDEGQGYARFNLLANKVRTEFNVSPIELDNILYNMGSSS